jgi:hypothetical protein
MSKLKKRLNLLKKLGVIHSYVLKEQIPSFGDTKYRLVDTLKIIFPGGEELGLETFCSGCMENTSIELMEE